jgi:transcriptional regulator with GAF, ATPase, and Fis domain
MDPAFHEDGPAPEGLGDMLVAELDALAQRVPFDLGVVTELTEEGLEVRAAAGSLAKGGTPFRTVALAECSAERDALETLRERIHRPEYAPIDPLSGTALPNNRVHLTAPLLVGHRPVGTLTLVRTGTATFEHEEIAAATLHARILALALQTTALSAQVERLRSHSDEHVSLLEIELRGRANGVIEASASPDVQDVAWRARQVAPTDTPVVILGETGVGKEWLAHAIHRWSARADKPFIKMNCAAIAAGTLDSELFGHEKGAFTGAMRSRPGRFQIADGGTLLLDEVGELPAEVQAKLLRVLQDGTFFPVGSDRVVQVDVRILAATHVDLERAIDERTFREDLFYRLNVFPLRLPPLRERLDDLPMLCEVLLAQQMARTGRRSVRVSPSGIEKLAGYAWPGNLRELGNVLERATILSRSDDLGPDVLDLPRRAGPSSAPPPPSTGAVTLDEAQRRHIGHVLAFTQGKVYGEGGAAQILGVKPSTLQSRMRKLGVRRLPPDGGGAGASR